MDNGDGTCTATLDDPTEDGYIEESDNPSYTKRSTLTTLRMGSYLGGGMRIYNFRGYIEWDLSTIPDGSTINNVVFMYHGQSNSIDCHIHEMVGTRPSTNGAQAIYDEAGEGTVYVDQAGFPVVGTNRQINLGANACTDLQNLLTSNWFAIGIQSDNENSFASSYIYAEEYGSANPKPTLVVTYTPPSC